MVQFLKRFGGVLAILLLLVGCATLAEQPSPRGASVPCYMEQGGAKFVAESGCEIEVQSGATFDLQSGATTDFSGGVDLDGADLIIDADGDTSLSQTSSTDDAADVTLGASTGYFSILTGNLRVGNGSPTTAQDGEDTYLEGDVEVDGNAALGDAANDTTTINGDMVLNGIPDTDANNYNYWFEITGDMTGTTTKDRNYGLLVEMTRPAGEEVASGDFDEAGIKVRVDTEAVTTTTGTVLRGIDVEAKADNPDGTVTNLYGAALTSKSDTDAGEVGTMIALQTNAQNNAAVTDALMSADLRLMRQAATEPTAEYVVKVRNSSTSGTGADAGIYMTSDYGSSATTDSMDYGIDMSSAAINTADLRLENGETIDNGTDTVISFSAFVGAAEQTPLVLTEGGTITPTGTYQPITSATAITTSATTAIANGVKNGQLLILVNENASDAIIVKDSANTHLSGDLTLGNDDTLMLIWDGADWLEIGTSNNS
jgi:hypothetical protein